MVTSIIASSIVEYNKKHYIEELDLLKEWNVRSINF